MAYISSAPPPIGKYLSDTARIRGLTLDQEVNYTTFECKEYIYNIILAKRSQVCEISIKTFLSGGARLLISAADSFIFTTLAVQPSLVQQILVAMYLTPSPYLFATMVLKILTKRM